jgi:zinc transport system ATP-binding protein
MAYGSRVVLSGLNFCVGEGDYLCVVGRNGSGKSTLVKGLLRLMPTSAGRVTYGCGLAPGRVGYLPQGATSVSDFPAGVYEVVLSGCLARRGLMPFYTRKDKRDAIENMRLLGVGELAGKCFAELSGGQRQRALLARALCSAESLLIMDEPVAGLDPDATRNFYDMTDALRKSCGMSIVMVSHDVSRALASATHVLHLDGRQEFFGSREEYLHSSIGGEFAGGQSHA